MSQRRSPRAIGRYDFGKYAFFLILVVVFLIAFVVQSVRVLPGLLSPTATLVVKYSTPTVAVAEAPTESPGTRPPDEATSSSASLTVTASSESATPSGAL